jgi:hypothetical protein
MEACDMDRIADARERLEQASGLPAVLGAAYDAFEDMLSVIEDLQDPGGGAFAAFVMSGASAASGRDAVAAAPSLPPPSQVSAEPPETASPADAGRPAPGLSAADATAGDAAVGLAGLSQLLAGRLADAGAMTADAGDRAACAQAWRYAADICSLLGEALGR